MIEKSMYTVFDNVAQESGPIFFANNDEHALRLFGQMIAKTPDVMSDDFSLYKLGIYNSSAHMIVSSDYSLITADSIIRDFDEEGGFTDNDV